MKTLITLAVMLFSFSSIAYEEMIFDGAQRDFSRGIGHFYSEFYVDQSTGEAGVRITFDRSSDEFSRSYTKKIPMNNMFLEAEKLMININGEIIECGTMGESRILKVPTLYLSGKCSTRVETKNIGRIFRPNVLVKAYLSVKTSK